MITKKFVQEQANTSSSVTVKPAAATDLESIMHGELDVDGMTADPCWHVLVVVHHLLSRRQFRHFNERLRTYTSQRVPVSVNTMAQFITR